MFAPALKVKRFLDCLAYFLLIGNTDGVVTNYKNSMNAKREIPMSSCPQQIENAMYGLASPPLPGFSDEEERVFRNCSEDTGSSAKKRRKKETKFDRWAEKDAVLHFKRLERSVVDTENEFTFDGNRYRIDILMVRPYAANETGAYGMDYVICGVDHSDGVHFFDQNFREINLGILQISGK